MLKDYSLETEYAIEKIKNGDIRIRDEFIKEHIPFINKVIYKVTGRYVDLKNSDEFSIGLSAFNEAIDRFDVEKHYNFFKFCEQVIKRRIIDYIRSNKKNNSVFPFTYFNFEDGSEEKYLLEDQTDNFESVEIKQEIGLLKEILQLYGVSVNDLVLCSPKHKDSKLMCIKIAKTICDHDKIYNKFYKNKKIPTVEVMKALNVSERTIERNRKFIIAVSIILKNDFTTLKEYIEK